MLQFAHLLKRLVIYPPVTRNLNIYKAAVIGCSRMGGFIDHESVHRSDSMRIPPRSHGAGYYACDRIELVGCSDTREDVMEQFGLLYDVPKPRQYTNYKELIDREKPDVVSVATQPEQRAEIVRYIVENGVRAVYAEKAMSASLQEAKDMVHVVESNGAILNLGTNRRWHRGYAAMKTLVQDGTLGDLNSIIIYQNTSLFNGSPHSFDLALYLNNDVPVSWVQAHLPEDPQGGRSKNGDFNMRAGDSLFEDPSGHGIIQFTNGVSAYALLSGRASEFEATCEYGIVTAIEQNDTWVIRKNNVNSNNRDSEPMVPGTFPEFKHKSTTLALIEDLVQSLDTGHPPAGGIRTAYASTELLFAFLESHRQNGARVALPLKNSSTYLKRDRAPRQPLYSPRS